MGKGLAAAFKQRYPDMFVRYKDLCDQRLLDIGKLWLWKGPDHWVLNFPTKRHWRVPSSLEFIEAGLKKFVSTYEERGISEISFPRLGCGNGGLDWNDVRPMMEKYLGPLPIPIYIHDFEKDLGIAEHLDSEESTDRGSSFDQFWTDLKIALNKADSFFTFANRSPFSARINEPDGLRIERGDGRVIDIPHEELFGVWTLLNRGLITRQKLAGRSFDEAYYLLPVLASLPYIEPVEVARPGMTMPSLGVRMKRRSGLSSGSLTATSELK